MCVDFDGVINPYSRGWDDGTIYDEEPLPGARESIDTLLREYAVVVFTSRDDLVAVRDKLRAWLPGVDVTVSDECRTCDGYGYLDTADEYGVGGDRVQCGACDRTGVVKFWNERNVILVTNRKLPAYAYVDDRSIEFKSWDQVLRRLGLREGDEQPLPTPTDGAHVHDLVAAELMKRKELGTNRYGTPLQAHNGRDALVDVLDELLDAACYIQQLIIEKS